MSNITQEQFIDQYIANTKAQWGEAIGIQKTRFGISYNNAHQNYAIPCDCEDETCEGWQMISEDALARQKYLELMGLKL